GALALDALASTHPIYATVRSVAEATENFDAITYEKGAAVVRMIEHYLGPEPFRDGVRLYMRRHRDGNTVAADLWRALEEAAGRADATACCTIPRTVPRSSGSSPERCRRSSAWRSPATSGHSCGPDARPSTASSTLPTPFTRRRTTTSSMV